MPALKFTAIGVNQKNFLIAAEVKDVFHSLFQFAG
jgi:hypothetical protein